MKQTDCLTITDKKLSIQEKKQTKDIQKKKQKEINDNSYIKNGNDTQNTIYIIGDSMVKKLNGYFLTKEIKDKHLVKIRAFSGAKVSDINPELFNYRINYRIRYIFKERQKWCQCLI